MDPVKKYGLLSGLAFTLWQYVEYLTGFHNSEFAIYSGFVSAPIFIMFLFLALRQKRRDMGGYMEFADGLKTGLGVSVIAGIIYSITFYIYCKWVNPQWVLDMAAKFRENISAVKPPVENIDEQVKQFIENYAFRSSLMVIITLLFMGGIISVIMSAIMRRKPPTADVI